MTQADCLFCRIVAGEIPSDTVHEDELVLAFNDINPMAPLHQLVIPKQHIASSAELSESQGQLLGRLFAVTAELAVKAGVDRSGYRVVTNVGADGGQSVDHLHFHLLGGRSLTWPPG